jgi:hypothetical protein
MNSIKIAVLLILFFKINVSAKKITPNFVQNRFVELSQVSDTVIFYKRGCSGDCIGGTSNSAYFLYKKKNKYMFEYYRWDFQTLDIYETVKTASKSKEVKAIFKYMNKIDACLNGYNGYINLYEKTRKEQDVFYRDRTSGVYVEYKIKCSESLTSTTYGGMTTIQYYIEHAPCVGGFLLALNMLHYHNSFDGFLDL